MSSGDLPKMLKDNYGRTIRDLRISITDRCNFRCFYCMPKEAMEWQLNALSNIGLLSRFIGMLTDSRSFMSYPRHEYFRRVLCNLVGGDIERGELPDDLELVGGMVRNICFANAKNYLGLDFE